MGERSRRPWLVVLLAMAFASIGSASAAAAPVTVGQTGVPDTNCAIADWGQPSVNSGNSYVVPSTGGVVNWEVTSWSHYANSASNQTMKVKVFRAVSGTTYTVVGQDGPRSLAGGVLNTFSADFPVKAGDVLGMTTLIDGSGCGFGPSGQAFLVAPGSDAPTGAQVAFEQEIGERLNISATVEPISAFSFGATTRNKRRGTAAVTVNAPNPGTLDASAAGAKLAGSTSKSVASPGPVTIAVKAKGKKRAKLNRTGKVKLKLSVSFTATGGPTSTSSTKVKLKKKL